MKTGYLLILGLMAFCININGQHLNQSLIADGIRESEMVTVSIPLEAISNKNKLIRPNNDDADYLQKSKLQKVNGLLLITGGSVMRFLSNPARWEIPGNVSFVKSALNQNNYENNSGSRLALTGPVMMAGSIPYFIASLKNKKIAGIQLVCQKTSFGASNKARKKVTGITYSIPLGK